MRYKTNLKTTATFRLDKKLKREIQKQARLAKTTPSAYIEQQLAARLAIQALEELKIKVKESSNG